VHQLVSNSERYGYQVPAVQQQLIMYSVASVCSQIIVSSIPHKLIYGSCKIIADTHCILPWHWLALGADHIQSGW